MTTVVSCFLSSSGATASSSSDESGGSGVHSESGGGGIQSKGFLGLFVFGRESATKSGIHECGLSRARVAVTFRWKTGGGRGGGEAGRGAAAAEER